MTKNKYTTLLMPPKLYRVQERILKFTGMNVSAFYKLAFWNYIKSNDYTIREEFLATFHNREAYVKKTEVARYFMDEAQEQELDRIRKEATTLKILSPIKLQAVYNYCIKMADELGLECELK